MISVEEAQEVFEEVPHVKGCRNEFAPQLCNCARGVIAQFLEESENGEDNDE